MQIRMNIIDEQEKIEDEFDFAKVNKVSVRVADLYGLSILNL